VDPLELLTVEELADLLKVTKQWLYDQEAAGQIKGIKLGRYLRFRRAAVEEYLLGLERKSGPNSSPRSP
jgi:excisionase family DNA binding protein